MVGWWGEWCFCVKGSLGVEEDAGCQGGCCDGGDGPLGGEGWC